MTDRNNPHAHGTSTLRAIVRLFGGTLLENGHSALIPGRGHSKADRSVSLRQLPDGRILIHCFSPKDDWRAVQAMLGASSVMIGAPGANSPHPNEPRTSEDRRIRRMRKIWMQAVPLQGTRAEIYLRVRGILTSTWPSALRFHPEATSLDDKRKRPALIAAITNNHDDLQGVQITLLTPCGRDKAAIETPRRVIGKLSGGAVRLCDGPAPGVLIAAEGVETALSASDALDATAWSALSAGNLSRFTPPDGVSRLIIAADRGAAGEAAAEVLMTRMANQRLRTEIAFAPDEYPDWNDWARRTP